MYNSKHRWALLLGALLFCGTAVAGGKKPPPKPDPQPDPPPVTQPLPIDVDNTNVGLGLGLGLGYGEGGDGGQANSNSNADADANAVGVGHGGTASADSAAVVGDTTAVGLGGRGGDGGAGGRGGDGGHADATGGNAAATGGIGLGGSAAQGQSQGIASSGNSASTSHGGASQARGGDQSQGQSASLSGGNNEASSAARGGDQAQRQAANAHSEGSTASSGGNSISVDASSQHRTLFIPSVTQGIAPSIVPGANVTAQAGAVCGPRQEVVSEAVSGTFHGLFVRRSVDQGTTDTLRPAPQAFRPINYPDGSTRYYGHQVTTYVAAVGVSGARSLALGGGGSRGDWGQGSLGTSSANQRLVIKHVLTECELGASGPAIEFFESRTPRG